MSADIARRAGREPMRYEVVVVGELTQARVRVLDGLTVEARGGRSIITGDIVDQSQLHGVLAWLGDMGVEIVSVRSLEDTTGAH